MKANEYFKKHGYKKCKSNCRSNAWLNTAFWVQLKRIIEAHDLVDSFGGLDGAKKYLRTRDVWVTVASNSQLIYAIQLVESCQ